MLNIDYVNHLYEFNYFQEAAIRVGAGYIDNELNDLLVIFYKIFRIQTLSFFILIICLIRIPSTSLAFLFNEIPIENSGTDMAELVVKWRKQYVLICELVASLNDFIGKPLLIFVIYAFVSFVGFTFHVLFLYFSTEPSMPVKYALIITILENVVYINILAYASEKISSEVSTSSQSFYKNSISIVIRWIWG